MSKQTIVSRVRKSLSQNGEKKPASDVEKLFGELVEAARNGDLGLHGDQIVITRVVKNSISFHVAAKLCVGGQFTVQFPD